MTDNSNDIEQYMFFSMGIMTGVILSYTGIFGFLLGVGTGIVVSDRHKKFTTLLIKTVTTILKTPEKINKIEKPKEK